MRVQLWGSQPSESLGKAESGESTAETPPGDLREAIDQVQETRNQHTSSLILQEDTLLGVRSFYEHRGLELSYTQDQPNLNLHLPLYCESMI